MQTMAVCIGPQIKMLILNRPPKSLDENIVQGTAFRIHADGYLIAYQRFDKVIAGELTALICIENLGLPPP